MSLVAQAGGVLPEHLQGSLRDDCMARASPSPFRPLPPLPRDHVHRLSSSPFRKSTFDESLSLPAQDANADDARLHCGSQPGASAAGGL